MGQGVNTKIRQLVADEFAIAPERVLVMATSTEKNNNTSATAASSGADLNGSAAVDGAQKIRMRMTEVAREHFERTKRTEDLGLRTESGEPQSSVPSPHPSIVWSDGRITDGTTSLSFEELVRKCYLSRVSLGERGFYVTQHLEWDGEAGKGTPFLYFTMGAAVSEVEIDRFTGMMRVLRSDLLMDIGRSINPGIDRGQITGAFVQGLGWLTNEELRYSAEGDLLSHSPTTYKIPNIQDLPPEFHVDWIDNPTNVKNVRASKAVGEPPLLLAISVFSAIKNALGFLSGSEIPKLNAPATGEEILLRMTAYRRRAHGGESTREVAAPAQ
jgi:xanthine dehydrogenase large subunit